MSMWPFSALSNSIRRRRRAIFRFWDGARELAIDPMLPFRALAQHDKFDWDTTPALIDLGNLEAMGVTADAVRKAFGVKPIDESGKHGLTESECVQLLIRFVDYMQGVKKNISTKPISTERTAPPPGSPMSSGSDSFSTSHESNSVEDSSL